MARRYAPDEQQALLREYRVATKERRGREWLRSKGLYASMLSRWARARRPKGSLMSLPKLPAKKASKHLGKDAVAELTQTARALLRYHSDEAEKMAQVLRVIQRPVSFG